MMIDRLRNELSRPEGETFGRFFFAQIDKKNLIKNHEGFVHPQDAIPGQLRPMIDGRVVFLCLNQIMKSPFYRKLFHMTGRNTQFPYRKKCQTFR